MIRRTLSAFVLAALAAPFLTGCPSHKAKDTDYEHQLPPGELALRKITDPRAIPDFTVACTNTTGLRESVSNSLDYLAKPSSQKAFPYGDVTHDQAVASLNAMLTLLDSGKSPGELNAEIRAKFDVYISVGCDDRGTVLYTGYYTPIFNASPVETDKFKYPLYKPPAVLKKRPDGTPESPMPDRKTIEATKPYVGNELVWMADPFEAYVTHIQGSARLRMPDGKEVTVGYAANNGHEYKSIRAILVQDGRIEKRAGLPSMLKLFHASPELVKLYTAQNPRYIFFAFVPDGHPRGCLNEPVTSLRSIATDKKIFPPACLAFVSTQLPMRQGGQVVDAPFRQFVCDQDAGGAIRAPGRCDVYMGVGEEAGQLAGRAQNEGKLYYLFLKPEAVKQPGEQPAEQPAPAEGGEVK